jgi:hypothetical protein
MVISLVEVLVIGTLCRLHSFLYCYNTFEKVRAGTATHAAGSKVEVNVQVHGVEFMKLVGASLGNVSKRLVLVTSSSEETGSGGLSAVRELKYATRSPSWMSDTC